MDNIEFWITVWFLILVALLQMPRWMETIGQLIHRRKHDRRPQ